VRSLFANDIPYPTVRSQSDSVTYSFRRLISWIGFFLFSLSFILPQYDYSHILPWTSEGILAFFIVPIALPFLAATNGVKMPPDLFFWLVLLDLGTIFLFFLSYFGWGTRLLTMFRIGLATVVLATPFFVHHIFVGMRYGFGVWMCGILFVCLSPKPTWNDIGKY